MYTLNSLRLLHVLRKLKICVREHSYVKIFKYANLQNSWFHIRNLSKPEDIRKLPTSRVTFSSCGRHNGEKHFEGALTRLISSQLFKKPCMNCHTKNSFLNECGPIKVQSTNIFQNNRGISGWPNQSTCSLGFTKCSDFRYFAEIFLYKIAVAK